MSMYPFIKVLQPEPFDLVDQRVQVGGVPNHNFPGRPLRVPMGNRI